MEALQSSPNSPSAAAVQSYMYTYNKKNKWNTVLSWVRQECVQNRWENRKLHFVWNRIKIWNFLLFFFFEIFLFLQHLMSYNLHTIQHNTLCLCSLVQVKMVYLYVNVSKKVRGGGVRFSVSGGWGVVFVCLLLFFFFLEIINKLRK